MKRQALGFPSEQTNAFRVVNAEGDGLTGLVVDQFDQTAVVQLNSLAQTRHWETIAQAVMSHCKVDQVRGFVDDQASRLEAIEKSEHLYPESTDITQLSEVTIKENGVQYTLNLSQGQKTGFYFDQRDNRARFASMCRGEEVLDLYSYVGAFSFNALRAGAKQATAVETSKPATERSESIAKLNGLDAQFKPVNQDVSTYMRDVLAGTSRYSRIVCDPPKFVRSRAHLDDGLKKYIKVNTLAMDALAPGGLLLTCSCSGHVDKTSFLRVLTEAGHRLRKQVTVHAVWGAGADHPIVSVAPQTEYLKAALVSVD